ncbi:MAG: (Fe-S)-binding protein [Candidatus Methanomethylophilaceae archaeon]|jgi:Fe-S oxidoreductase|nr:Fe-S oxidoreductase [Methanomassiliicoccales archaeon RumEn M2]MDD4119919.1 (Fe-S)-binding protein [Candidatus Methanomethylophilaceae archaeon]MDI9378383.1 (Fe-S)-binding protein [Candidatus Thermoplasmatota archaeon]
MSDFETDKMEKIRDAVNVCTMCGFCKSVCPSFKAIGWDSELSRGRIILSYGLLTGEIPADESVVKSMYTCTTCADCVRRCTSKVDIVEIIEATRADLVKSGHILPKHKAVCENIIATNNPYGEKRSVKETLGREPKKAEVGYFAGCTATYRNKEISAATISILDKLKVDYTTLDEVCCGSVMVRIGWSHEDVAKLYQRNLDHIKSLGIKTLVLSCSGCYRMFKTEYPRFVEVPFEVLHISEFLARQDLKLKPMNGVVATYHDPCHLGRHVGVYDAPREVIKKIPGLEFREMEFSGPTSHCCGGGGGVRSAFPEESGKIARTRMEEADFADLMITSCPFCVNNLILGKGEKEIRVVDLVELVDELL